MEPNRKRPAMTPEQEEYRNRHAARAKRRRKRQMQRLALLAALVMGLVIVVVGIVWIVKTIFNPQKQVPAKSNAVSSSSVDLADASNAITWPVATDPTAWNLILVNNQVPMPEGFNPERTVVTPIGHEFDARAAENLTNMVNACNAVEGNDLRIISGYVGPQTQGKKYQDLVDLFKANGQTQEEADASARAVEPPFGYSDHQTALAVDFVSGDKIEATQDFADSPEYKWLVANGAEYGFILRFPKEKVEITGINYQPYHFRYVGVEDAKIITQAGISLEEYLAQKPAEPPVSSSSASAASAASKA